MTSFCFCLVRSLSQDFGVEFVKLEVSFNSSFWSVFFCILEGHNLFFKTNDFPCNGFYHFFQFPTSAKSIFFLLMIFLYGCFLVPQLFFLQFLPFCDFFTVFMQIFTVFSISAIFIRKIFSTEFGVSFIAFFLCFAVMVKQIPKTYYPFICLCLGHIFLLQITIKVTWLLGELIL